MSPELMKVASRARNEPSARFHSLAHLIDVQALERAYHKLRSDAAVGVDGVTKELYGLGLEENLRNLHERLRGKRYRHQPIRRVNIPKDNGGTRPLGISVFEDKIVQEAIREVLSAVYEEEFLPCSYGYRPGRRAHDAIRALNDAAIKGKANWILEADIRSFFDSVPHRRLMELLRKRVPDGALLRLVGKCLHVGVLEGETLTTSEEGTPQGSVLSPLLANIYLHYALDLWFEELVKPRLRGKAEMVRYADDFVICFEREEDARRVFEVLPKRMEAFGLTLHPEKTRLTPYTRPSKFQQAGKGPGTFDFLGFTFHWNRTRAGWWANTVRTSSSRMARAIQRIHDFCQRKRHLSVRDQHDGLVQRLRGHINYFGVNGNCVSVRRVIRMAVRGWQKWLSRRSQRCRMNWGRFKELLRRLPLPKARVAVQIWG